MERKARIETSEEGKKKWERRERKGGGRGWDGITSLRAGQTGHTFALVTIQHTSQIEEQKHNQYNER